MRIEVLYFAGAREATGTGSETLEVPIGTTVASLREALALKHPPLVASLPRIRFAVGERFAAEGDEVGAGDVVALIPPVSGG